MSAAQNPSSAWVWQLALAFAMIAGVSLGFLFMPSGTTPSYVLAIVQPLAFGGMCVAGLRAGGRPLRILPSLLLVIFLLDMARGPQVSSLSALGLTAGAIAALAGLRGNQRWAIAGTITCCALLAATLVGGLWQQTRGG